MGGEKLLTARLWKPAKTGYLVWHDGRYLVAGDKRGRKTTVVGFAGSAISSELITVSLSAKLPIKQMQRVLTGRGYNDVQTAHYVPRRALPTEEISGVERSIKENSDEIKGWAARHPLVSFAPGLLQKQRHVLYLGGEKPEIMGRVVWTSGGKYVTTDEFGRKRRFTPSSPSDVVVNDVRFLCSRIKLRKRRSIEAFLRKHPDAVKWNA